MIDNLVKSRNSTAK